MAQINLKIVLLKFLINLFLEISISVKDAVTITHTHKQLKTLLKTASEAQQSPLYYHYNICHIYNTWHIRPQNTVYILQVVVLQPPHVTVKLTGGDGYVMTTEVSEIWCQHLSVPRELASSITILTLT